MAKIHTVPPRTPEIDEDLAEVYDRIGLRVPGRAHILEVQSLNPKALEAHHGLYRQIMFGPSPLSRTDRELVAVVVSAANGCAY